MRRGGGSTLASPGFSSRCPTAWVGENAGEVASALVVESLARAVMGSPPGAPADVLEDAVQEASGEVVEASHQAGRHGMGATLTALLVKAHRSTTTAFIAEVGDSRAYLLRAGRLTLLTKDQSYTQLLLDAGTLDAKEAAESPLHNVILQAMGHASHIDTALGRLELRSRDCLLLCSDGLTNAVADEEICRIVLSSSGLEEACNRLVDVANERGGKDNVTVLAAGVGGEVLRGGAGDDVEQTFQVLASFEPKVR
jgi:serine/threonine protein phosphatase PrpC